MILVTGGSGQVSSEIYKLSKNKNYKFIFKSKKNLDISNFERVKKYINENNFNKYSCNNKSRLLREI